MTDTDDADATNSTGDAETTNSTDDTGNSDVTNSTDDTDNTDVPNSTDDTNNSDVPNETHDTDETIGTDVTSDAENTSDGDETPDERVLDGVTSYATRPSETEGTPEAFAALRDRFAGSAVIGLGEASHGSRDFFACKARLIRYLVREMGVRAVAFEANLPEARALDRYVVHGEGDPVAALHGTYFWTWAVESVLALVEWLRSFNEGRPIDDRVRFYGFDAQYTQGATRSLRTFFERVDPTVLVSVRGALRVADDEGVPPAQDDTLASAVAAIERLVPRLRAALDANGDRYADATSDDRVAQARRDLRVLERAAERKRRFREGEITDRETLEHLLRDRDRAMAANVAWIDRRSEGPVVCWGHDAHVNRVAHRMRDRDVSVPSMGAHLADRYGDDYLAVGFAAGRLGFRAMSPGDDGYELREWTVDGPLPGTTEATVARALARDATATGVESAMIDLRGATSVDAPAAVREWLTERRPHLSVGATYEPGEPREYLTKYAHGEAFDLLWYLPETHPTRPVEE